MGIKRASEDSAAVGVIDKAGTVVIKHVHSSRSRSSSTSHEAIPVIGLAASALAAAAIFMIAQPAVAATVNSNRFLQPSAAASAGLHRPDRHFTALAQGDNGSDAADQVQTKQVAQYVAVYKAMQKNHSLTVDQACAQQGITVAQFRDIENKVERDDALTALVRKALNPADTSSADDDNDN